MIRQIIHIDEEKCNGCGICVTACHEGAISLVEGKAKLTRDDYCDGLGDCLPNCPTGAITFERREALAYDREAVERAMAEREAGKKVADREEPGHTGCPGTRMRILSGAEADRGPAAQRDENTSPISSGLGNWPVQIKLAPLRAPYFDGARLLIAADCTAYTYARMHQDFMKGHVTIIGCPKLDDTDYSEKLAEIIRQNDIRSVRIVRMEVPCCGGIEFMAKKALQESGKFIPWQVTTISIEGKILD